MGNLIGNNHRKERRLLKRKKLVKQKKVEEKYFFLEQEIEKGFDVFVGKTKKENDNYNTTIIEHARITTTGEVLQEDTHDHEELHAIIEQNDSQKSYSLLYNGQAVKRAKSFNFQTQTLQTFINSLTTKKVSKPTNHEPQKKAGLLLFYDHQKNHYVLGESNLNPLATKKGSKQFIVTKPLIFSSYTTYKKKEITWQASTFINDAHNNKYAYHTPAKSVRMKRITTEVITKGPQKTLDFLIEEEGCREIAVAVANNYNLPVPQELITQPPTPKKKPEKKKPSWNFETGGISMAGYKF